MACVAYGGRLCVVQQRSDVSIPVAELSFRHRSQRSAEIDSFNIADQLELNTRPPTADMWMEMQGSQREMRPLLALLMKIHNTHAVVLLQ